MHRNRITKEYMLDFFLRNLTQPGGDKTLPTYL